MSKKLRLYIAGPMRGIKDFNFPAFDAAAKKLRAAGHEVFNPADRDRHQHGPNVNKSATGNLEDIKGSGFSLRDALAEDLAWICLNADAIYLLPGWRESSGALAEHATARALGLQIFYGDDMDSGTLEGF